MSQEISLSAYMIPAAMLFVLSLFLSIPRLPWPKLRFRGSTEKHRGIRVIDVGIALSWPRSNRRPIRTKATALEFALYFTIRM